MRGRLCSTADLGFGVNSTPIPATDARYYPSDLWAARGALVLKVNYRGSAGYGQRFRQLNVRNLLDFNRRVESGEVIRTPDPVGDEGDVPSDPSLRRAVGAAKVLTDFARENDQRPAVKGGLLAGAAMVTLSVAGAVVTLVPTLVLFLFLGRKLVDSIQFTGIK